MRVFTFFAALGATALCATSAFAGGKTYSVELNKTEILRLPASASAVVIGNPKIADVSVHAVDTLFVVGRGFGETNLIVLDADGNTMMDADIRVVGVNSPQGVRIFNAKDRETYSCLPYCQPSPVLGDERSFLRNNTAQEKQIDPLTALFNAAAKANAQYSGSSSSSNSGTSVGNSGQSFSGEPN